MQVRFDSGPREAACVVLVHGAGMAGWMWKCQMEALSGWRLIVVDLPDHGLARAEPFTSIAEVADGVAAWVGKSLGRVHLVGHSLGARVVLEILSRRPEVARSAVISSALVRPSRLVSWMSNHTLNRMSLWMLQNAAIAKMQALQFGFPDAEMTAAWLADMANTRTENLDRPMTAFAASLSVPPGLGRVVCPVLVTAGTSEPAAMASSVDDIVAAVPAARAARLRGAPHTYPWSRAKEYNHLLTSFLRGESAAP